MAATTNGTPNGAGNRPSPGLLASLTKGIGALSIRALNRIDASELVQLRTELDRAIGDKTRQTELFGEAPAVLPKGEELIVQINAELATVLSPSQVAIYRDCSAKWYFRYFRGLPDVTTGERARGKAFHRAAAANFRQKIDTKRDLPREEVLNIYAEEWKKEAAQATFDADDNPADIERAGATLLQKLLLEAAPEIQPAIVEQPVNGTIGGVKVRGIVDLMDTNGSIIDLKTAAKKPSGIRPDYAFQLATYRQITPGASGRANCITLVSTKTPQLHSKTYEVSEADVRATQVQFPLAQEGMRSGLYFPNRNSVFCSRRSCAFWSACQEEFGGTVEE